MKLKVRRLAITTGDIRIVVLGSKDAERMEVYYGDRVSVQKGRKKIVATVDITRSQKLLQCCEIGLFEEVFSKLGVKTGEYVDVQLEPKPKSIQYIKKKLEGKQLTAKEIFTIIEDISEGELTDIELSYFVSACYSHEMNLPEIVALTKAMINTGEVLKLKQRKIIDIHCIGGVAGNRTTMIIVPILVAAGLTVPKTSSRAITSASGTADTVELLAPVSLSIVEIKRIVNKVGGCMCWGGAVNLAPADDKIIRVEHPMSLDPTGQLLASILGKKKSVSASHVLIEIPIGKDSKIESRAHALHLKHLFEKVARQIHLKIKVLIMDGSEPVGNGIGPALEVRDVLWTLLTTTKKGPEKSSHDCPDLREKSLVLAGETLELAGRVSKGKGYALAQKILESGKAYETFCRIIRAQGGRVPRPEYVRVGRHQITLRAKRSGTVRHVSNTAINKIARAAGSPMDKQAGVYLWVHRGDYVKKGKPVMTIYSDNRERLMFAQGVYAKMDGMVVR